ncbi:ribosomal protein VAR1 (mitochondrion) [Saccharomyces cerevisiae YJM1385]|nr:ribosomal protein VAR1 [Saccharomyces cerevisiae YJM1385]
MKLKLLNMILSMMNKTNNNNNIIINNTLDSLMNKKLLLKNMLLDMNNKKMNNMKRMLNNNNMNPAGANPVVHRIGPAGNINNKLQHLNNMNNWNTQIYNYNKNMEIMNTMNDKLINKLLYKMMTLKLNNMNPAGPIRWTTGLAPAGNINKIIMSKTINQHSLNKLNIKFYYYNNDINNNNNNNNNNYYMNMMNKLMNIMNNNMNNNLCNILSYYYNKKVTIEPIKLSYIYLNSDIFSKYISLNDMDKYNNGILTNYQRMLNNIMPKLNDHNISMNYINNINNINNNKYNNMINLLNNNNNNNNNINNNNNYNNYNNNYIGNINNIYNNMTIDNIPMDILMYKYLVGWSIKFKGRLSNNNGRTSTTNLLNGTFNNKKYLWSNINNNYKLNYIPSNHNLYNNSNINKNGKYNIKVKLNFI